MNAGEEPSRLHLVRLALIAAICGVVLIGPSSSFAVEPARLSLGFSAHLTHWELASEEPSDETAGDRFGNAGVVLAVDLHRWFAVQAEVVLPYRVSAQVDGREEPYERTLNLDGFSFFRSNLLFRYRPLGRTSFAPIVGAGLSYQRFMTGYFSQSGDDEDSRIGDSIDEHQWQGVAALGLDWNSGWKPGSTHFTAEMRLYGPPAPLAAETDAQRDWPNALEPLGSWAWEVWLGIRLSVL